MLDTSVARPTLLLGISASLWVNGSRLALPSSITTPLGVRFHHLGASPPAEVPFGIVVLDREAATMPARPGARQKTVHPAGKKMISASRCAAGEIADLGESRTRRSLHSAVFSQHTAGINGYCGTEYR
jgi:hypothetical protein